MATEDKQGYCTLCRSRCGTINTVRDNMLIAVRPDPTHPTGQAMCAKGRAAPELVYSPQRLQYPMRRTRPKGDVNPGWVRISWDAALAETAQRLNAIKTESGAEAVVFAVTTPSGTPLVDSIDWIERFVRLFGSPNICYATEVCNWHKDFAHAFTFGCGMPPADYENAGLIVLWGHNPANTWLAQAHAIGLGRAKGAKMVVVDPRPTAMARQADVWLQVRPGTDAALALGLIRLLIINDRFDEDFVRDWTNAPLLVRDDSGYFLRERDLWPEAVDNRFMVWDQSRGCALIYDTDSKVQRPASAHFMLRGSVTVEIAGATVPCYPSFEQLVQACAAYTPAEVERITGVAEEPLRVAAAFFGDGRRVAYHAWTGIGQHTNATQCERAVATLYALTGSFDKVGGNRVRTGLATNSVNALALLSDVQRAKALGLKERPLGPPANGWVTARDTYRAILKGEPYKVRAMMAFGTNLPLSQADTAMAHEALKALEFHVHCDIFETPAAQYADILLPINTPWEREGLRLGFEINDAAAARVQLRQRMVSPRDDSRSDNEIVFDLACRLGLRDEFFGGSLDAGWNYLLQPLGLTVQQLRAHPGGVDCKIDVRERKYALENEHGNPNGFATETRRVELYSELLLRHGQPPVACFVEPADSPRDEVATRHGLYPLVLSSAKNGYYCHSQHRSLVSLRRRSPDPLVELSPALSAARQISEGDWVLITTRIGEARFVARLSAALSDDVVVAEFGWWQACFELDREGLPIEGSAGSNFNSLVTADACDPISGSVPHRSFLCDIRRDPATDVRKRHWPGLRPFRVKDLRSEAEGVLGIHFEPVDGGLLPDFRPGQHLQIQLQLRSDEAPVTRAYSLTGAATVPARTSYSIAVRHLRSRAADGTLHEGLASSHLHRTLRVGDVVHVRAPSGSFVLPRVLPQPLVLFAGGIGITPFLSLLESIPDGSDHLEIWLFYANQNGATHAFRDRIAAHAKRLPGLRAVNHYSAPRPNEMPGVDFESQQLINASVVDNALIARRARFYLCGPGAMVDTLTSGLITRGVPRFDIFSEVFRSPAVPVLNKDRSCQVKFARSGGMSVTWAAANGVLLGFAESLGIMMSSGCRVGQCESCAVRIIAGKVQHLHGAEPDDASICLACQAIPMEDVVLDA